MPLQNDFETPQTSQPYASNAVTPPKSTPYAPGAATPPKTQPSKPAASASSNDTNGYVRGGGASVGTSQPAAPIQGPRAYPGPRPPQSATGPSKSSNRNDDFVHGGGSSMGNTSVPSTSSNNLNGFVHGGGSSNGSNGGPSKSSNNANDFVRGGGASVGSVSSSTNQQPIRDDEGRTYDSPVSQTSTASLTGHNDHAVKGGKHGGKNGGGKDEDTTAGQTTESVTSTPTASVSVGAHSSQSGGKDGNGVHSSSSGTFQASTEGGKNNDFGGSTAVAVATGSSAGLSDIQKARKFTFQIEKTKGKLNDLASQEDQLKQLRAGTADPLDKIKLNMQIGSVKAQQQVASDRLRRKEARLSRVEGRMAGAGSDSQQGQGLHAVAVGQNNNTHGSGQNNGGEYGNSNADEGGVLTISHGDNDVAGGTGLGVATDGVGPQNNASSVVAHGGAGTGGNAGLSDLEKARKFSYKIEEAENTLSNLATQESQIRAAMGATSDPAQQEQLAVQLGSVQQQQQDANSRLLHKTEKLNKVEDRMAAAGADSQQSQELHAVAVGPNDTSHGNSQNGNQGGNPTAQVQAALVDNGSSGGRPVATAFNGNGNGNRGNGNQGNGNGNGGGDGNRAGQGGGGGNGQGNGNGNNALAGAGNGNHGNGNGNGNGQGNGNGNGNGAGGSGHFMGGPVGGGDDSSPTRPPKLIGLGNGGGGTGSRRNNR